MTSESFDSLFIFRELNTELKNKINDCRNNSETNKVKKNRRVG